MNKSNFIRWLIENRRNRFIRWFTILSSSMYPFFLKSYFKSGEDISTSESRKKTCFTLSFDCDYEEDIKALPDLLAKLESQNIKASFACIGKLIEKFPAQHRLILQHGHEIINHTYSHPAHEELDRVKSFNEISPEERKEEILKCHEVCKKVLNYEPGGFRVPHFGRAFTNDTYQILKDLGRTTTLP